MTFLYHGRPMSQSSLHTRNFNDRFNVNNINKLCDRDFLSKLYKFDDSDENAQQKLNDIHTSLTVVAEKMDNEGFIQQQYSHGARGLGRVTCTSKSSIQLLPSALRPLIIHDDMLYIDIHSAGISTIVNLSSKYGYSVDYMQEYLQDKEKFESALDCETGSIKSLVNRTIGNGKFDAWAAENDYSSKCPDLITYLLVEINQATQVIFEENQQIADALENKSSGSQALTNIKGKTVCLIIFWFESRIEEQMVSFIQLKKYVKDDEFTPMHDGVLIPIGYVDIEHDELCYELEQFLMQKTKWRYTLGAQVIAARHVGGMKDIMSIVKDPFEFDTSSDEAYENQDYDCVYSDEEEEFQKLVDQFRCNSESQLQTHRSPSVNLTQLSQHSDQEIVFNFQQTSHPGSVSVAALKELEKKFSFSGKLSYTHVYDEKELKITIPVDVINTTEDLAGELFEWLSQFNSQNKCMVSYTLVSGTKPKQKSKTRSKVPAAQQEDEHEEEDDDDDDDMMDESSHGIIYSEDPIEFLSQQDEEPSGEDIEFSQDAFDEADETLYKSFDNMKKYIPSPPSKKNTRKNNKPPFDWEKDKQKRKRKKIRIKNKQEMDEESDIMSGTVSNVFTQEVLTKTDASKKKRQSRRVNQYISSSSANETDNDSEHKKHTTDDDDDVNINDATKESDAFEKTIKHVQKDKDVDNDLSQGISQLMSQKTQQPNNQNKSNTRPSDYMCDMGPSPPHFDDTPATQQYTQNEIPSQQSTIVFDNSNKNLAAASQNGIQTLQSLTKRRSRMMLEEGGREQSTIVFDNSNKNLAAASQKRRGFVSSDEEEENTRQLQSHIPSRYVSSGSQQNTSVQHGFVSSEEETVLEYYSTQEEDFDINDISNHSNLAADRYDHGHEHGNDDDESEWMWEDVDALYTKHCLAKDWALQRNYIAQYKQECLDTGAVNRINQAFRSDVAGEDNYEQIKEVVEDQYVRIINPPGYFDKKSFKFINKQDMHFVLQPIWYTANERRNKNKNTQSDEEDEGNASFSRKLKAFYPRWCTDSDAVTYKALAFVASPIDTTFPDDKLFNTFDKESYMKVTRLKLPLAADELPDIRPLQFYFEKILAGGCPASLYWWACFTINLLYLPANNQEVFVILYSREEGTGKNTVGNFFFAAMNHMYGKEISGKEFFGKKQFDGLSGLILVVLSELKHLSADLAEDLKAKVTAKHNKVNVKNEKVNWEVNYRRYILCLNWLPRFLQAGRRIFAWRISEILARQTDFWNELYSLIASPLAVKLTIKWLRDLITPEDLKLLFSNNFSFEKLYRESVVKNGVDSSMQYERAPTEMKFFIFVAIEFFSLKNWKDVCKKKWAINNVIFAVQGKDLKTLVKKYHSSSGDSSISFGRIFKGYSPFFHAVSYIASTSAEYGTRNFCSTLKTRHHNRWRGFFFNLGILVTYCDKHWPRLFRYCLELKEQYPLAAVHELMEVYIIDSTFTNQGVIDEMNLAQQIARNSKPNSQQ